MNKKQYYKDEKRAFIIFIILLVLLLCCNPIMKIPNKEVVKNNSQLETIPFNPLESEPIVQTITPNAQYFKNGDLIKLRMVCDQSNYSILANFSTIDDHFLPDQEQIVDYQNGTYLINYPIHMSNARPNGRYQITINTTNPKTGLSILNKTYLNLDNSIPNITGSVLAQFKNFIWISLTTDGTDSPVIKFQYNISQFSILFNDTNPIGNIKAHLVLFSNPLVDSKYTLNLTITDSVNLVNSLFLPFMVDTTPPSYDSIIQNISMPEYYHNVNVSVVNPTDAVSGIKSIILNYTIDNGIFWNAIDITQSLYGVIPKFPYQTQVIYRINLTDNYGNSIAPRYNYTVIDHTAPTFENIQQSPINPNQFESVNISITNVNDVGAGIANIFLNYSVDNGKIWTLKNITTTRWGVIENQPRDTTVFYQVVITDKAENVIKSNMTWYVVQFIDILPPFYEAIVQNVSAPEYNQAVKVSIVAPQDTDSGIQNILLYYSINNGTSWTTVNLTQSHYGVLPKFPYQTQVIYRINLTDNVGNINTSELYNYIVNDHILPVIGNIQRFPHEPNQFTTVNISIIGVFDAGAGTEDIYLNYSVDNGNTWILKNITAMQWGLIENQPQNTRVFYQIIVFDRAGNEYKSNIENYTVLYYYDYGRLFIILLILGSVVAISTYYGKIIYSKRKLRKLKFEYLNAKEEFKSYINLRLEDVDVLLNDIESVEANLNKLLKIQWVPEEVTSDQFYKYRLIKEFIGITQFSNEINLIKTDWRLKNQEFEKKFGILEQNIKISKQELRFRAKTDACVIALGTLLRSLRKKYPLFIRDQQSYMKVEYPLDSFDQKLAGVINEFQAKYNDFAKEFDHLLILRRSQLIEDRLNELELLFRETDEWLKGAEEWSKIIPLPKDRGYYYLLKLKKEQYISIKDDFNMQIEKFRTELSVSTEFAQDFMKWYYNSLNNKLKKFEKAIYEDLVRFVSTEDLETSNIDDFIKKKFDSFNITINEDKRKINDFYESHKEFHLQEIYDELTTMIEEIPINLKELRVKLNKYIQPLYRLFKLIKGVTTDFYTSSVKSIEKLSRTSSNLIKPEAKFSFLDELFSEIIWEVNRIDNEIKKWIDLLPFDLETPQLMILLRSWSEIKEDIFEKLNKLGKEKKIYKCEIMHEVLDPLNTETWECSNCGAIACLEHLERWYHRKQAPECFKCGKEGTFKLKVFAE